MNGNVKRWIQTPTPHDDRGGDRLTGELLPPAQAAEVVDGADGGRDGGAEQDPAHLAVEVEERERRDEDPEEEREAAEPRDAAAARGGGPPPGRSTTPSMPRHAADRGREQDDDAEGDQRAPEDLEVRR